MMLKQLVAVSALLVAPMSAAALSVIAPSSKWWWQEGDQALLTWDCSDRSHPEFAVVASNPNITLMTAGYAVLVGIQKNDVCTTNIVPNLLPGAGYKISLTNIVNYTDVYTTGEAFEVHTKGSPYPSGPTPVASGASTAVSATGSAANTTRTGASSPQVGALSLGGVLAVAGSLVAFLGA